MADVTPGTTRPRPLPRRGEIHIWRFELPARDGRLVARRGLRSILAEYLGDSPEFDDSEGGKPHLAVAPERLSFNLSHTAGLALVGISQGSTPIGVDVERLRPRRNLVRLAERWLPPVEATAVAAAPASELEETFYAAWTRYEARLKCTGAGIGGPLPGPEVVARQMTVQEGYAAAIAFDPDLTGTPEPELTVRIWTARDASGRP